MGWRERFVEHFAAGYFAGTPLGAWLRLLSRSRFAVHPKCWPRALAISGLAPVNSLTRWIEEARFSRRVEDSVVREPVFVLGHWRSGTTHLQQLLVQDPRLASPNLYQVFFPHTFLTTERFSASGLNFFLPRTRGFDNVHQHAAMAHEDEIALCSMSGLSCYLTMAFPSQAEYFDRFLTFKSATEDELRRWRADMEWYGKKLAFHYGSKTLVLKSPPHTARIALLRSLFPDARFIHIHRHPFDVYRSTIHLLEKALKLTRLQRTDRFDWSDRVLRVYAEMHDAYLDERSLLASDRLVELAYDDLVADPLGQLRQIYSTLKLPDFDEAEPAVSGYLDSLRDYKRNRLQSVSGQLADDIAERWRPYFEAFGYSPHAESC